MQLIRAKHHVKVRKTLEQLVRNFFLLHHAAAHAYYQRRVFVLHLFKRAYVAEHLLFRVIPYAACIEKYNVSRSLIRCRNIAAAFKYTRYFFRVMLVHLAAIRLYIIGRLTPVKAAIYPFRR